MNEPTALRQKPVLNVETKVSSFDLLNSILVASIMIFGFLVSVLFLIWLTTAFDFSRTLDTAPPKVSDPGNEKPLGEADDVLDPGVEEFPEVETPQLANALEAVTDSISSIRAAKEKRSGSAVQMGKGSGFGSREGGDGDGGGGVPEWKRWIINYESENIDTYSKQLSHFNIDIGVVHKLTNDIWKVADVGGSPSVVKTDRDTESKMLRFMHKKPRMQRWDQTLAKRQGVDLDNAQVVQFYPESTRAIIRKVEDDALKAEGRQLIDVRNTIISVVPSGSGFEFQVDSIIYQ